MLFLANETQMKRLQELQNWAKRIILGCNRRSSLHVMLHILQSVVC